jgi:hypothetical protein
MVLLRFKRILHLGMFLVFVGTGVAHGQVIATLNSAFDATGWQMRDATKVPGDGTAVSALSFSTQSWYQATVPGTVLTTLVDNHVYPEPLYGENNRPNRIPDSLARTPFWYRTVVAIPRSYRRRRVWLHLDGINYSAMIWVNRHKAGEMRGAFCRGIFDISGLVHPGKAAAIAILVMPEPHPGVPHEHTLHNGMGHNGGVTALDGPTFLSTIGWDWMPAIGDRDTGLWRKVWLSSSGPVTIENPSVTTDLKIPDLSSADITVKATLHNLTAQPQEGYLDGTIGDISFQRHVSLPAGAVREVTLAPANVPGLHMLHPALWWPNGYGPQNLHRLTLNFVAHQQSSEQVDVTFGIRKITYRVPSTDALAFVVNGVPVFIRGGDWGMDEAMKRLPYTRMDAEIRLHKLANLNMIRNWVGQSTSEEFFDLCDKYGILVWDEFFQPNPADGPDPEDLKTYMANVRDTVLGYRNHPSIALWCARNEGNPPAAINDDMKQMLAQLDPDRLYQADSSDGRSVRSHGPYRWRNPRDMYWVHEGFKSETGSVSIPTLESIQGMMPERDWNTINDDWAEHDFARGASGADLYPEELAKRYGTIMNLADFVRKAQLANYEDFRAMYEGRNALLFHPTTGVLTWMSNPAQPSFVWQLYHYDLEPNASFFAVKHASEMLHVQFNQVTGAAEVINNYPETRSGLTVQAQVFNVNGTLSSEQKMPVAAFGSSVVYAGGIEFHEPLSRVFFIRLRLIDSKGSVLSENFYWITHPENADQLAELNNMPGVRLIARATWSETNGVSTIHLVLHNPSKYIALMAHVQLRQKDTSMRVLPAYYSGNYVSLLGGEDQEIDITCSADALKGTSPLVMVDGWNVTIDASSSGNVSFRTNEAMVPANSPRTGFTIRADLKQ